MHFLFSVSAMRSSCYKGYKKVNKYNFSPSHPQLPPTCMDSLMMFVGNQSFFKNPDRAVIL